MIRHDVARLIRQARKRAGWNQEMLARKLGCSGPYVTMLEKGRSAPSPEMSVKLEQALGLPPGKLLETVLAARMKAFDPTALTRVLRDVPANPPGVPDDFAMVPLLGACPASAKRVVRFEAEDWVPMPRSVTRGRRMYLLRAAGDSMNKAGINDGDVLLVDADAAPRNGDVVVARIRRSSTIKRFFRTERGISLLPDSTNLSHKPVTTSANAELFTRGVVEAIYLKRLA